MSQSPNGRDIISHQPLPQMTLTRSKCHEAHTADTEDFWCIQNSKDQTKSLKDKKASRASVTKICRWEEQRRALKQKHTFPCRGAEKKIDRWLKSHMQQEKQTICKPKPKECSSQIPHWGTGIIFNYYYFFFTESCLPPNGTHWFLQNASWFTEPK